MKMWAKLNAVYGQVATGMPAVAVVLVTVAAMLQFGFWDTIRVAGGPLLMVVTPLLWWIYLRRQSNDVWALTGWICIAFTCGLVLWAFGTWVALLQVLMMIPVLISEGLRQLYVAVKDSPSSESEFRPQVAPDRGWSS